MLLTVKKDTKIFYQMSVIIYQSTLRPITADLNVLKNNYFQEISGGSGGRE
jgi:hypothetical protein